MLTIHGTRKLLAKVKQPVVDATATATGQLGGWYATDVGWRPGVALFVNEATLLPVLLPLAPAATLGARFPDQLGIVLAAIDCPAEFTLAEVEHARTVSWAKTANRSVVGVMNEFAFLADHDRHHGYGGDPLMLSLRLVDTPCSPLYKTHITPRDAVHALSGIDRPSPG